MADAVLVTGANGFVGKHVVRALSRSGRRIVALSRDRDPDPAVAGLLDDYLSLDLTRVAVPSIELAGVVHLAGLSAVGPSFNDPQAYLTSNTSIMTNLFEPLMARGSRARVVVVSTGAVYDSQQTLPIDESGRVAPSSPYVVSKLAVEHQAMYYARRGLSVVVARPFNHIGPGQRDGFLVPDLIKGIREFVSVGKVPAFGDLSSARDYTDVRDVARAYADLIEAESLDSAIFNVCSGRSISGNEMLTHLAEFAGVELPNTAVNHDRLRPNEPSVIAGSYLRLARALNWKPTISVQRSLQDAWAGGDASVSN